jgi:acylphosphatase
MTTRAEILVDGDVQGVGFRYYVRREARRLGVTGYVENLDDGTVKIVGEAQKEKIDQLVERIRSAPSPVNVVSLQLQYVKPTGEYKTFKIKVGDPTEELVEGFATGAAYFEVMFSKQDQMLAKQDQMLEKQDQMLAKQDQMLAKQDQMLEKQDQMLAKQDQMLAKQDQMLEKQDSLIKKVDVLVGEVSGLRQDLRILLEERIVRLERDITEIKTRLGIVS